MPDDTLRLPVGSFEIIQRILAAYATLGQRGPVKLKDVAERTAMQATAVSGNHAFLESIGIIDGGKQKSLTELGRRVAVATTHAGTLEARNAWSMVVAASDHLQKIVDAVRIRQGMKEDALTTHIVVTAGVPKSTRALTGARTVLDLLREAGVIEEIDGTFRATASAYVLSDAEPVPSALRLVVPSSPTTPSLEDLGHK